MYAAEYVAVYAEQMYAAEYVAVYAEQMYAAEYAAAVDITITIAALLLLLLYYIWPPSISGPFESFRGW